MNSDINGHLPAYSRSNVAPYARSQPLWYTDLVCDLLIMQIPYRLFYSPALSLNCLECWDYASYI